jgi:hypothetical protein
MGPATRVGSRGALAVMEHGRIHRGNDVATYQSGPYTRRVCGQRQLNSEPATSPTLRCSKESSDPGARGTGTVRRCRCKW